MNELKYDRDDLVLVYKEHATLFDGALAKIIDRDPNDNSYLVSTLEDIFQAGGDLSRLYDSGSHWVKESDLTKVSFDRPKTFLQRFLGVFKRDA